ncbi:hypothetical protein [Vibrio phage phiKT1019]|nr:hypothetical protein [Vibrio phage phiKT1019]
MSNVNKRKQAKRKARQRNVQANKVKNRLKEVQERKDHAQAVFDENFGGHEMSDGMKVDAKKKFWEVFSKLPVQLQKEAIESFEKNGNKVTPLDVEGITNLLCEGLNYYIRPHALVATLHSLVEQEKLVLTPELLQKMDEMDAATLNYISKATAVLSRFELLTGMTEEQKAKFMLEDEVLSEELIPTMSLYQQDKDEIIDELIELASPHTDLVDEDVKFVGEVLGLANLYDVSRQIHLERVEDLLKVKGK